MQISNLVSGVTDATGLTKPSAPAAPAPAGAAPAPAANQAAAAGSSLAAMREILAKYDVTDISPADFSKLIQSLYDKGAISKKDLQDLSAVRADLDKAGVDPDTSIDLLDFYRKQVAKTQRNSSNQGTRPRPLSSRSPPCCSAWAGWRSSRWATSSRTPSAWIQRPDGAAIAGGPPDGAPIAGGQQPPDFSQDTANDGDGPEPFSDPARGHSH